MNDWLDRADPPPQDWRTFLEGIRPRVTWRYTKEVQLIRTVRQDERDDFRNWDEDWIEVKWAEHRDPAEIYGW